MDKLGDIELFVTVVRCKGLAAAGRKMGISPASVTARLNRLESGYGVRLLTRTTRQISLTDEGSEFYSNCLEIMTAVNRADESLTSRGGELKGNLRVTATADIGKQIVAPVMAEFSVANPNVKGHLQLADHVLPLTDGGYDLAIRFGGLADNRLVARKLIDNRRVMFASPTYLKQHGVPSNPDQLVGHRFLGMARDDQELNIWHFEKDGNKTSLPIEFAMTSNDGSLVRQWAVQGYGIALKSYCDIHQDLKHGRLQILMEDYQPDYVSDRANNKSNLYAVYPSKHYLPLRVRCFLDLLQQRINQWQGSS